MYYCSSLALEAKPLVEIYFRVLLSPDGLIKKFEIFGAGEILVLKISWVASDFWQKFKSDFSKIGLGLKDCYINSDQEIIFYD